MSAPVADKALAERLAYWRGLELECEALRAGRGFRLEEALGEAHRSGQLITLAEAQAMVAAENERCAAVIRAEMESAKANPNMSGYDLYFDGLIDAIIVIRKPVYIRAAATGTKEGE